MISLMRASENRESSRLIGYIYIHVYIYIYIHPSHSSRAGASRGRGGIVYTFRGIGGVFILEEADRRMAGASRGRGGMFLFFQRYVGEVFVL